MNISTDRLVANDGSGLDDRPQFVTEALEANRKVGYRDGKPLVPHPDGEDDGLGLGDDPTEAYSHYKRGESLLLPEAGDFVRRLFESEHVESVADAASEVNSDRETVEKAADLHGISTPLEADGDDGTTDSDMLTLPSGETVPFDPLHPLVLAQLLSDGMSVEESAQYLSEETGEHYTPTEVREAAQEHSLLSGGDGEPERVALPSETMQSGAGEPASTPWQ